MKNIVGAVQELPAKQHSQSSPFSPKLGWIGCAIQQATSKRLPGFLFRFNFLILIFFLKYKTIETHARAFLPLNISAVGSVYQVLIFCVENEDTSIPSYLDKIFLFVFFEELRTRVKWGKLYNVSQFMEFLTCGYKISLILSKK